MIDLTIHYLIPVTDWRPDEATPTSGFALGLCYKTGLFEIARRLPASVSDWLPDARDYTIASRILGVTPYSIHPQSPRAIRSFPHPAEVPFVVVLMGKDDDPATYREWADLCVVPPTLIADADGDITYAELGFETFKERMREVATRLHSIVQTEESARTLRAICDWTEPAMTELKVELGGHNTIHPNLAALFQLGYHPRENEGFKSINEGIAPYVEQIDVTTKLVDDARKEIRREPLNALFKERPDLNLFAPAMFPDVGDRLRLPVTSPPAERKALRTVLDILNRQDGYAFEVTTDFRREVALGLSEQRPYEISPHPLMRVRQLELALATQAVATMAASDISSTIRLPNSINRTSGSVRQFAGHYRSERPSPRKRLLAFRQVQARLKSAMPANFMQSIRDSEHGIRIITDAHLEWLDLDGLPLFIRKNVTRIPATPGNLFVEQALNNDLIRISNATFQKVIVISALDQGDIIRKMFDVGLELFGKHWQDTLDLRVVDVKSGDQFAETLNGFDGAVAVFDGHGSHHPGQPGRLHFADGDCDVWNLRQLIGKAPPIMLLAACDTHAADRNHATTANGFLSLGVRSVLSSVFPLQALDAATFCARFLHRIANYIPVACEMLGRPLVWTEVVSGMLRMQLLTDFLRQLERKNLINSDQYHDIHLAGNIAINGGSEAPFEEVIERLESLGLQCAILWSELETAVANSSVISYVNVGRADTVLVDTEERAGNVERAIAETTREAQV